MGPESLVPIRVGDEHVVDAVAIAHGGHVIAHAEGRTLFVRHALPGERVRVVVTDVTRRIVRADVVEVLVSSPDRVDPRCAHSLQCGGCDFQHVGLAAQRALKEQVLRDALQRFGGVDPALFDTTVREVPGDALGLRWRTRMRWAVGGQGALSLRAHRRHDLVPVGTCVIAAPDVDAPALRPGPADAREVVAAQGTDGRVSTTADGRPLSGPGRVVEEVGDRTWRVAPGSFWQVHPGLAATLQEDVRTLGGAKAGETWWDLYSGAGLLAATLATAVGPEGAVDAVEMSTEAVREARRALHDLPQVRLHSEDAGAWVAGRLAGGGGSPHGVVLDPPRAGAGAAVVDALARIGPAVVVYVACDPVALGRDIGLFAARGYRLDAVRAHDGFPMTHHLETVARIVREDTPGRVGNLPDHQIS